MDRTITIKAAAILQVLTPYKRIQAYCGRLPLLYTRSSGRNTEKQSFHNYMTYTCLLRATCRCGRRQSILALSLRFGGCGLFYQKTNTSLTSDRVFTQSMRHLYNY